MHNLQAVHQALSQHHFNCTRLVDNRHFWKQHNHLWTPSFHKSCSPSTWKDDLSFPLGLANYCLFFQVSA